MSLPHDEQPLTRRQLREMERQKPRKERDADAKAAEEAEAARKARVEREDAEAAPVVAAPVTSAPATPGAAEPAAHEEVQEDTSDDVAEDTIIPEVVTADEAVDDTEPSTYTAPLIDIVPLTDTVIAAPRSASRDDEAQHVEIIAVGDDSEHEGSSDTVIEEMVIDVPGKPVDPTSEAAAHVDDQTATAGANPPLAPFFQSPSERARVSSDELPSSFDDLLLRNTAAANSISTTSALVLPTVPGSNDVGTALDETGEVIITGSIDLPSSFGSLGAPASGLESGDLDSMLERSELETGGSDVAPVSAARAISTNTSSTSLIAPPKRARANAPVVLAITAGVLAVGVVGLLLAVFVFRVF